MTTNPRGPLPMTELGFIPNNRQRVFYRVTKWMTGALVADFATKQEADQFAIADARSRGCKYDHAVATIIMRGH